MFIWDGDFNMIFDTTLDADGEIVKCGFWCKLPLFYHFCGAPMQIMKISDFPIYSFTNDLLPPIYKIWNYKKVPIARPSAHQIFHNPHNLL